MVDDDTACALPARRGFTVTRVSSGDDRSWLDGIGAGDRVVFDGYPFLTSGITGEAMARGATVAVIDDHDGGAGGNARRGEPEHRRPAPLHAGGQALCGPAYAPVRRRVRRSASHSRHRRRARGPPRDTRGFGRDRRHRRRPRRARRERRPPRVRAGRARRRPRGRHAAATAVARGGAGPRRRRRELRPCAAPRSAPPGRPPGNCCASAYRPRSWRSPRTRRLVVGTMRATGAAHVIDGRSTGIPDMVGVLASTGERARLRDASAGDRRRSGRRARRRRPHRLTTTTWRGAAVRRRGGGGSSPNGWTAGGREGHGRRPVGVGTRVQRDEQRPRFAAVDRPHVATSSTSAKRRSCSSSICSWRQAQRQPPDMAFVGRRLEQSRRGTRRRSRDWVACSAPASSISMFHVLPVDRYGISLAPRVPRRGSCAVDEPGRDQRAHVVAAWSRDRGRAARRAPCW